MHIYLLSYTPICYYDTLFLVEFTHFLFVLTTV